MTIRGRALKTAVQCHSTIVHFVYELTNSSETVIERYKYDCMSRKGAHVQRETVPPGEKPEPL